mmetsp:Transcript_64243/g.168175  ORF Transcript_64243/g.168175 Transcript_64243/m.168175 type:complete len:122 (+) Transcript_64243:415-780(+)
MSVPMGKTVMSEDGVLQLLVELERAWPAAHHDDARKSCRHFCDELCRKLGVGTLPDWVCKSQEVESRNMGHMGCCAGTSKCNFEDIETHQIVMQGNVNLPGHDPQAPGLPARRPVPEVDFR